MTDRIEIIPACRRWGEFSWLVTSDTPSGSPMKDHLSERDRRKKILDADGIEYRINNFGTVALKEEKLAVFYSLKFTESK